ncbi:MAG: hypothetical protein LBC27_00480 [Spirochaetaceae bacterium]|jgi:hypothetical protein|nr:hypothetical protein [Spirochaetaceae bacterium]
MTKKLLSAVALLFAGLSFAPAQSLDSYSHLLGKSVGDILKIYPNLKMSEWRSDDPSAQHYYEFNPDKDPEAHDYKSFDFYNGKLYSVRISYDVSIDHDTIVSDVEKMYGELNKTKYFWQSGLYSYFKRINDHLAVDISAPGDISEATCVTYLELAVAAKRFPLNDWYKGIIELRESPPRRPPSRSY